MKLKQYDRKDTIISIGKNLKNINIKLNPNFGVLKINPKLSDNLGSVYDWQADINGLRYSLDEEIRLEPGKYNVKLTSKCYADLNFSITINKGGTVNYDEYAVPKYVK